MLVTVVIMLAASAASAALPRSPFDIQVAFKPESSNQTVRVDFTIPPECILYAERLHFASDRGDELTPSSIPQPINEMDKASKKVKKIYEHDFTAEFAAALLDNGQLTVKFQGCSNGACYFPEKRIFAAGKDGSFSEVMPEEDLPATAPLAADWAREMHDFKVTARQSGYLPATTFIDFLDRAASGRDEVDDPLARFNKAGLGVTLLLIALGGLLLNLTPCVLPMIPINLAIIGAGTAAASRRSGFVNGAIYGAGMALAYGALGLAVVLTGAKFGALNSSIWFNVLTAALFAVLGLGMFDVFNIDLSRFGGGLGPKPGIAGRGGVIRSVIIFVMGIMAALLAGACVAPVVISALLLAANIYSKGHVAGLLLPFLLGLGMALPWPFAGAGLAFLPKPGKWMNRVKHGFGALILLFALYYVHLALGAYTNKRAATSLAAAPGSGVAPSVADTSSGEFAEALRQARLQGRPVLVDFHASWCKNCLAMDETVFKKSEVKKRVQDFIVVRYDAERPGQSPAREVLDHFGVMGLPTYVVLTCMK